MRLAAFTTAALLLALPAQAGNWTMDPATSKITFTGSQSGAEFTGTLPAFTADITFDPADLAHASVTATMPLAGVSTGSGERDHDLPGEVWLNVEKFPTATFTSTGFKAVDTTHYTTDGTLTIKGISQPLTVPFELVVTGDKAAMTGTATFARQTFEVGKGWGEDSGVGEEVKVNVVINATLTPPLTDPPAILVTP